MNLSTMLYPPGGPAASIACAILAAQADRLDRLNVDVTDELGRYEHSRARIGDLIERLVGALDALDEDPDLEEGSDLEATDEDGGDALDQPEGASWSEAASLGGALDGGDEDVELTSCETAGSLFTLRGGAPHDDAEGGGR